MPASADPDGSARSVGPLDGVRVVDLTSVVMGPLATRMLADLGADVIRVEAPGGDIIRHYEPMRSPAMSAFSVNLNRNKRSVVLDLKSDEGRAAIGDLIASADVFVTTMRRSALERLGLDATSVRAVRADIVHCVANGFGSDGPSADRAAYDDVIQAASGVADLFTYAGGDPQLVPSIICDKVVGLHIVPAITAALYRRAMTGEGDAIEVPMAEVMAAFNLVEHLGGKTFEPPEGPFSYARITTPHRRPRRSADGWVVVMPYTDVNWADFFGWVGRADLVDDERFASQRARIAHSDELYSMLDEFVADVTTAELIDFCVEHSIPASAVLRLEHVDDDPHFAAVDLLAHETHPTEGPYRVTRDPIRFASRDGSEETVRIHAPRLGQHTAEVMSDLGWSEDRIAGLGGAPG
ncbi:CaiB/BaiF CoA transferase family protein [Ilumatobacter sp.]|uniref:CaiB/BaiF CoA transferase family protein n=1 Tax=Ilumatobacter sp. TaxID=1967498 RepID=UPI003B51D2D0